MKLPLLFLPLFFLFAACDDAPRDMTYETKLQLVQPDSLELSYELDATDPYDQPYKSGVLNDADNPRINLILKNNNKYTLYLLSYTCSNIPGHLKLEPETIRDEQDLYCNMSYPFIAEIKPNKCDTFSTNLRLGKQELKKVDLYLRFVNRKIDFELLKALPDYLEDVYAVPFEKTTRLVAEKND